MSTKRHVLIVAVALALSACGGPAEEETPVESAIGWTGAARLEGDYFCPNGETWHVIQPVSQTYTRPIDHVSRYNVSLVDDGQPWPVDGARNTVRLFCTASLTFPTSPTCNGGALCSTNTTNCAVMARWRGQSSWTFSGRAVTGTGVYSPPPGARGAYQIPLGPRYFLPWPNDNGNGMALDGCNPISYAFGG